MNPQSSGPDDLKSRLKMAMQSEPMPAHLETRVRASLRSATPPSEGRRSWFWTASAAGAMALVAMGFFAYRQQHYSTIAEMTQSVSRIVRVGLEDHLHCTILRHQPKVPKPLETMKEELGPRYAALLPAVSAHVPEGYQVLDAHHCHYRGREFVHLVMNQGARYVSVVVANQQPGESFSTEQLVPALAHSGLSFYQQGNGRFRIAGFESAKHLVYIISDLPEEQNRQLMMAMGGDLQRALPAL